jgi:hypothetical protein
MTENNCEESLLSELRDKGIDQNEYWNKLMEPYREVLVIDLQC